MCEHPAYPATASAPGIHSACSPVSKSTCTRAAVPRLVRVSNERLLTRWNHWVRSILPSHTTPLPSSCAKYNKPRIQTHPSFFRLVNQFNARQSWCPRLRRKIICAPGTPGTWSGEGSLRDDVKGIKFSSFFLLLFQTSFPNAFRLRIYTCSLFIALCTSAIAASHYLPCATDLVPDMAETTTRAASTPGGALDQ